MTMTSYARASIAFGLFGLFACSETDAGGDGDTAGDGDIAGDGDTAGDGDGESSSGGSSGDGDSTGDGDTSPGMTEIPDIEQGPSSGCGTVDPPTGPQSMTVGEDERTYIVSLPDGYDPQNAYPLIFAFHGRGGSGEGVSNQWYFGIEQTGGTPSIFVYPDGLADDMGTGWPNQDGRDVAFFDAMVETLTGGYCVDENRVFSSGHSYGGIMSFTLACERASVLRAVAPVAGARWAQGSCSGPVAALGIHGNPDDDVGYDLGLAAIGRIIETNGCDTSSTAGYAPTEFCTSYACDSGYPVIWCEHQSGHDWPDFAASSIKDFFDGF